ncbi:MAG: hypothetical protein DI563_02085 [Variovorax paradoxus]|uniref:Surface-adhesin protein E-like domain-containing protein n=1 Tax=Variovorax paradoxus TaxID=34073 RepID=A0A2W5QNP9_VARPD|nr:MAG: hypothetical protein DI563_02085 [Variovorax paradoxus]
MKSLLGFLVACALSSTAWGQADWRKFDDSAAAANYTDLARVQRDHYGVQTFRAWWLTSYKTAKMHKGARYDDTVALYRVDCLSAGLTLLQITGRDAKGGPVWLGDGGRERIALPDSIGENFLTTVCNHAKDARL